MAAGQRKSEVQDIQCEKPSCSFQPGILSRVLFYTADEEELHITTGKINIIISHISNTSEGQLEKKGETVLEHEEHKVLFSIVCFS